VTEVRFRVVLFCGCLRLVATVVAVLTSVFGRRRFLRLRFRLTFSLAGLSILCGFRGSL